MTTRTSTPLSWIGYALCNVGVTLGTLPFTLFLLYYLTQIVGIPPAIAGLIIAMPKVWDALIDPMLGGWIDRYSVRVGRRGPAIAVSAIVFAGSLTAVFSLPAGLPVWEAATIACILLILSSVAQTGIGVSQFALAPEMTKSHVELSALLAMAAVTAQLFSVAGSAAIPLLISAGGSGHWGYTVMASAVAAATLIAFLLFIFGTRNVPVRHDPAGSDAASVWLSLRRTIRNNAFYNLLGLVVCLNCSIALTFGFLPFANQYVLKGDASTLSLLETVLGVTVLIGLMLAPLISRYVSPLHAMVASNVTTIIGMLSLYTAGSVPLWATTAGLIAIGLSSGVVGVLIQSSILQAAQRPLPGGIVVALGFYLGIMVAAIKLGASAGAIVSGQLLNFVGFVSGAAVQSPNATLGLRMGYSLVPSLFVLAATAFLLRNITHERRLALQETAPAA